MKPRTRVKRVLRRLAVHKTRRPLASVPDVGDRVFLFLGGLHRSGTSIVHRLLRTHPSVSGFSGTNAPEDEGQHLQSVFPSARAFGGPGRFAFDTGAHMTEHSPLVSPENRDRLLREWCAYHDLGKRVLLEKSPPNIVRSRFLREMVPGARFSFIVRHPVAVSLATQKWSRTSLLELALHWYVCLGVMLFDLQGASDSLIFRYEDFVEAPGHHLGEICGLAGISPVGVSEKVENRNEAYLARWSTGEFERDFRLLSRCFPGLVELAGRLGYGFQEPYVQPWGGADSLLDLRQRGTWRAATTPPGGMSL